MLEKFAYNRIKVKLLLDIVFMTVIDVSFSLNLFKLLNYDHKPNLKGNFFLLKENIFLREHGWLETIVREVF